MPLEISDGNTMWWRCGAMLARATYIMVLFFTHIPFVVKSQNQRNTTGEVATKHKANNH